MKFTVLAKIPEVARVRTRFAAWLAEVLDGHVRGPLRVVPGPGAHRFYVHPEGLLGQPVDPLRFRTNIYVEGWTAWRELEAVNRTVALGAVCARVHAPIKRCAATHAESGGVVRAGDGAELLA